MKIWKHLMLGYLGGMIYGAIELLWRGRTHGSMFVLGGLCFVLIGRLGRIKPTLPMPLRGLVSAVMVTALELGCGLVVNQEYSVWDYRQMPLNYHGQICLPFSLLWVPLSLAAIWLYDRIEGRLDAKVLRLTF